MSFSSQYFLISSTNGLPNLAGLAGADAGDILHLVERDRILDRHILERRVLKNHERRQLHLPGHLLAEVLQHSVQLFVGHAALSGRRRHGIVVVPVLVLVVGRDHHRVRMTDELLPRRIDRQQAVVLDILVDQPQNQSLTHDGSPEAVVTVAAHAEPLALVVIVGLDQRVVASDQHIDQIVGFELIAYGLKHLQHQLHRLHALETRLRMQTVVAASAILLRKLLSEIVQQRLAPANRALGIRDGLLQQQATISCSASGLPCHELLELLDILITVERDAVPARSVAAGPAVS